MLAGGNEQGIWLLAFQDNTKDNDYDSMQLGESEVRLTPGSCKFFPRLIDELEEYFAGKRKEFGLPLVMSGTAFQNRVWQALLGIPYGETARTSSKPKRWGAGGHPRGRARERAKPPGHSRALSPRDRRERQPDWLRRRIVAETIPAEPGKIHSTGIRLALNTWEQRLILFSASNH
jgi:hypothetical protein